MSVWQAQVISLLPSAFPGLLGQSLAGQALAQGIWALDIVDLRDFGLGKHRQVDDTPAGGGAGMVLRADVAAAALDEAQKKHPDLPALAMSPRGVPLTQARVQQLADGAGALIFCSRFEGVDERFYETRNIEQVSIGDYVVSGGEAAAQVVLDAAIRLLPGVMGDAASADEESFGNNLLEYPHYTRPQSWAGRAIPDILASGDHQKIAAWRRAQAENITRTRRPDLWAKYKRQEE